MSGERINIDIKGWTEETRGQFIQLLREKFLAAYERDKGKPLKVLPPTADERIAQAVAAERERIRQLAISKHAWYSDEEPRCTDPECLNCDMRPITGPFADLLDGTS